MALKIKNLNKIFPATITRTCRQLKNIPTSFLQPKRLRIFREYDPSVAPQCAGRMVILSRMTDVRAEIDRSARTAR